MLTIETKHDFDLWQDGFDYGIRTTFKTLVDLLNSNVPWETIVAVIHIQYEKYEK